MINEARLIELMADLESAHVERTISVNDTAKFSEAVCAFANDMVNSKGPGYLLIGVDDRTGKANGLVVTDQLLQNLAGLGADGNILPAPAVTTYKISLSDGSGEVAVVEVQPSDLPPVRYKGLVRIRRGPRKGIANEQEERLLAERRVAGALTFDAMPCTGSTIADLALDLFTVTYRPIAVDAEVIAENKRSIEHQLASLRFFDLRTATPTHAGIILFGKDPRQWLPNHYVQYVRYDGTDMSGDIRRERRIDGDLLSMLRELKELSESLVEMHPSQADFQETMISNYPITAIREFLLNAVMHHAFDAPSYIRVLHFDDRIEVQNPGPLYGFANPANFPNQTSYRNPIIAEAMKVLGFVNRYGRGVERAQLALSKNGNPPAEFIFGDTYFGVIIRAKT